MLLTGWCDLSRLSESWLNTTFELIIIQYSVAKMSVVYINSVQISGKKCALPLRPTIFWPGISECTITKSERPTYQK